jgi:hypothetical protein
VRWSAALVSLAGLAGAVACNSFLGNEPGHLVEAGADDGGSDAQDDAGATDADADAPACTDDLSSLDEGDFRISFVLTTSTQYKVALLNQRDVCGRGNFWDVRLGSTAVPGSISIQTDDGAYYTEISTVRTVNDGFPHPVVVTRTKGDLAIELDGAPAQLKVTQIDPASWLGPHLPPLQRGIDVCEGVDGTQPLNGVGTLSNVCISR